MPSDVSILTVHQSLPTSCADKADWWAERLEELNKLQTLILHACQILIANPVTCPGGAAPPGAVLLRGWPFDDPPPEGNPRDTRIKQSDLCTSELYKKRAN